MISYASFPFLLIAGAPYNGGAEMSQLLALLGVKIDEPELAGNQPAPEKPAPGLAKFQREVLADLGSGWDDPMVLSSEWLSSGYGQTSVKRLVEGLSHFGAQGVTTMPYDPSTARLLPLWFAAAERLDGGIATLLTVRHPCEVVDSLWLRHGMTRAHGLMVWLVSFLSAERSSRGKARSVVLYDSLLSDWRSAFQKVAREINVVWPVSLDRAAPAIESELRELDSVEAVRRTQLSSADSLEQLVARAWDAAVLLATEPEHADALSELDAIVAELHDSTVVYGSLIAELRARIKEIGAGRVTAVENREAALQARDAKVAELVAKVGRTEHERDVARTALNAHEERVTEVSEKLERITRELRSMTRELQNHKARLSMALSVNDASDTRIQELERDHAALILDRDATQNALRHANAALEGMRLSTSWKVSAPLRVVARSVPMGLRRSVRRSLQMGWRAMSPWRNARRRAFFEAVAKQQQAARDSGFSEQKVGRMVTPAPTTSQADTPLALDLDDQVVRQAVHTASVIRDSELFDAEDYSRRSKAAEEGIEPALHYALYGEAKGIAPSDKFDPQYYGERYPDIAEWGGNRLAHFIERGRSEHRLGMPVADTELLPDDNIDPSKPTVLILIHEASRTGAPILGWNLARTLRSSVNVVSVLLRTGTLLNAFAEASAEVVGPVKHDVFNKADGFRLGHRLAQHYKPLYVIANSVETRVLVPGFAASNVPVVALVHEFSGYTKPVGSLQTLYEQAAAIVFPAEIVRRSSEADYPIVKLRRTNILPQGPSLVPDSDKPKSPVKYAGNLPSIARRLRPEGAEDALLVVGMGFVDWRKGVDLFVGAATALVAREPDAHVRFVWIGHGFKVSDTLDIASYLAEQVERSGLGARFAFVDAVENVEDVYKEADVLFLSSRLDPLPNVSIDAALRGIPVVCFADASGMAEILIANEETRDLVVPHLDAGAAAIAIGKLARDREELRRLGDAISALAHERFDMSKYVADLDYLGRISIAAMTSEAMDVELILAEGAFDPALYLGDRAKNTSLEEGVRIYVAQSSKLDYSKIPLAGAYTRRPLAGFNPYIYAKENEQFCVEMQGDPFAHYLRSGRPVGRWAHPVILAKESPDHSFDKTKQSVILHGHFHYTDNVKDLFEAVAVNRHPCRLVLTTDTNDKASEIRKVASNYDNRVDVLVVENRGRDVGPFLQVLKEYGGQCDLIGHVHGKRSLTTENVGEGFGNRWRSFLWQHLIGDSKPMMDSIVESFAEDPSIGLVFPEDPHLIGWEQNFEIGVQLAERMALKSSLASTLDFPVGTMFWARPKALEPLSRLKLAADEYPDEPLPVDGTILHAIERLLTFVVEDAGYRYATTYLPEFVR